MLLPLYDSNPKHRIPFQAVTVAMIAACVAVFLWQISNDARGQREAVYAFGAIPSVVLGERALPAHIAVIPAELTLISSMFLHGGWMHLIGNMVFLWVLGDNVEDAMGHVKFLAFYIVCGVAAALAQILQDVSSTIPLIGASGAISGIIGAYLVLHPKAAIHTLVFRFVVPLPAWIVLGIWIGLQVINAAADQGTEGGGVAWWAHIGGAVAGVLLIPLFKDREVPLFDGMLGGRALPVRAPRRERRARRPWH